MRFSYEHIHDAPLQQLVVWWNDPGSLAVTLDEGQTLAEIAFVLSKHASEGLKILKASIDGVCALRKRAALSVLAWPELADDDVRTSLLNAFLSPDDYTRTTVLLGFINLGYFPLSEIQISECLNSSEDRLAALAMIYQCRASPKNEVSILRLALQSSNPRIREYACDEIGDRQLSGLATEMGALLKDADKHVVQAVKNNLEIFE